MTYNTSTLPSSDFDGKMLGNGNIVSIMKQWVVSIPSGEPYRTEEIRRHLRLAEKGVPLLINLLQQKEEQCEKYLDELSWIQDLADDQSYTLEGCDTPMVRLRKIKQCCDEALSQSKP